MLTKNYLKALTGISLILVLAAFQLREDPFEQFLKKMESYVRANPQEKVYLHLDKPYYAIGDHIWFKSYILSSENDRLSALSKIMYVDLINERDSVVQAVTLPVAEGLSWGNFALSDSLPEGNYRIRAYTQLMLNNGPDYFFDKTIKIGNAWSNQISVKTAYTFSKTATTELVAAALQFSNRDGSAVAVRDVKYTVIWNDKTLKSGSGKTNASGRLELNFSTPKDTDPGAGRIIATLSMPGRKKVVKEVPIDAISSKVDLQFFPEGGNLVENLPCRVGIKAINATGKGTDVSGVIVDNDGNQHSAFNTAFLGMGNVAFTPEPGKIYKARTKFADGSEQDYPLPTAQQHGYVLSANNSDSTKLQLKVYISSDLLSDNNNLNIVVQHDGSIYFSSKANIQKQIVTLSIPKKDLPAGISHVVILAENNQPICERLVFIQNPEDLIPLKLETDLPSYARRSHVSMKFADLAYPVIGAFSVAVTNADIVTPDPDRESNILTTMLLTSDLKGYVERPNHYFVNSNAETLKELDNLMLTQGWSRFSWKKITEGNFPAPKFVAQQTLSVSGTISTLGGKPIPNARVSLLSSTKGLFMLDTVADANGHFVFDDLTYPDSVRFVIQGKNSKGKNDVEIKIDPIPGRLVTKNKNTGDLEINVNETLSKYISQSTPYFEQQFKQGFLTRTTLQLKEVKIEQQRKDPLRNSTNPNGAGRADAIVLAKDMLNCLTLAQCLQNKVVGLLFNRKGEPYLARSMGGVMNIFIDGIKMTADDLNGFPMSEIESIEVLKSNAKASAYGSRGINGGLVITTKRGDSDTNSPHVSRTVSFTPKGYAISQEFYSPKYAVSEVPGNTDLRTTVYWNPNILSDAAGRGKFDFYTSDQAGNYRVVLEGINMKGKIARKTLNFQVK